MRTNFMQVTAGLLVNHRREVYVDISTRTVKSGGE